MKQFNFTGIFISDSKKLKVNHGGINGATIELSKQVGDLAKLIMLKENYYATCVKKPDNLDEKIGDELADILGQVIRIADFYNIDLENAHKKARIGEDECLKSIGV
ncbi:MazG-like family protein [Clostridium boliviensis]|uniref:MazG-like family protein n=1 Tax=Clostridium boliviensis TaxID=318465 RepID=UPI002964D4B3|nr:MazG-like family protein [Clostridium boliviensis]